MTTSRTFNWCSISFPRTVHSSLNGSPAQVDTAYPPFAQFQYVPNSNFCGLDTVRAHFTYYGYNTESNGLVGQLSTNIATAAIQVAPLLRIVGSSVLDEAQSCNGASQEGIVEDEDAVVAPEQSGVKTNFTAYLNNPREDGIPVEEQLTFSHIGPLLIFDAQGNQIHDGDSITVWVTGPISGSTQVPFSVESVVPGASPESFTVSGADLVLPGALHAGRQRIPGWLGLRPRLPGRGFLAERKTRYRQRA